MNPKAIIVICGGYIMGVWFSFLALKKQALMERAARWTPARGRILESVVYFDPDRKGTHFRIRYEFTVGERVEGNTPRLAGDWFWNKKQQAAFVARYVPGAEVEVFYDPHHPPLNCLDRTDRSGIRILWILAIGGVIGASLILWLEGR